MTDLSVEQFDQLEYIEIVSRFAGRVIVHCVMEGVEPGTAIYDKFLLGIGYCAVDMDLKPNPLLTQVEERPPETWNKLHDMVLSDAATRLHIPLDTLGATIYPAHYTADDWRGMLRSINAHLAKAKGKTLTGDPHTVDVLRSLEDESLVLSDEPVLKKFTRRTA